jgi:ABC-2 type transport system permease protein
MAWNLLLKELKQYRTAFLVWSLTIIGLTVVTMAALPSMLSNTVTMREFLKAYPPAFLRAFSFNASSFENPLGFYAVYTTLYVQLLGSVFSITVTASILHKEQALGTAEFLIAKPLSRGEVAWTKIGAYIVLILALNAAAFLAGWLCLGAFDPSPYSKSGFLVIHVYGLAMMLAMGGIGLLMSQMVKRARSLTGPAIGIVLCFYLIDVTAKITTRYDALGWVSPFKWVDLDVIRPGYGFEWWRLTMFAVLIITTFASGVLIYRKKDILA